MTNREIRRYNVANRQGYTMTQTVFFHLAMGALAGLNAVCNRLVSNMVTALLTFGIIAAIATAWVTFITWESFK
jgi:hypothetical protein